MRTARWRALKTARARSGSTDGGTDLASAGAPRMAMSRATQWACRQVDAAAAPSSRARILAEFPSAHRCSARPPWRSSKLGQRMSFASVNLARMGASINHRWGQRTAEIGIAPTYRHRVLTNEERSEAERRHQPRARRGLDRDGDVSTLINRRRRQVLEWPAARRPPKDRAGLISPVRKFGGDRRCDPRDRVTFTTSVHAGVEAGSTPSRRDQSTEPIGRRSRDASVLLA